MTESAEQIAERIFADNAGQTAMQKHAVKQALTAATIRAEQAEAHAAVLREALVYIANPIAAMQDEAERNGDKLNGPQAVALSNDPAHLRSTAQAALSATPATAYDQVRRKVLEEAAQEADRWGDAGKGAGAMIRKLAEGA